MLTGPAHRKTRVIIEHAHGGGGGAHTVIFAVKCELLGLVLEIDNVDVLVFDGVDFHLVFPFVEDRLHLIGDDDVA